MATGMNESSKHKLSESGRSNSKRKTSEEKANVNKRINRDYSSDSSDSLSLSLSDDDSASTMSDTNDDKIVMIMDAFKDQRVTEVLSVVFNDVLTKRTEKIEKDIAEIKEENTNRDREMNEMKKFIDKFEQNERSNNAIISGLQEGEMTTEGVVRKLNRILGSGLKERDIDYIMKMTGKQGQPNKLRVVFVKKAKKNEVFKAKKKLKGSDTICITDDLTPTRTNLAFLSRQAARDSKLKKTWVHEGKIFAVKNGEDKPYRINRVEDIPK